MICVIVLLPCYLNLSGQMKTRIFLFNKQVDKKAWLWKEQSDLFGPAQKKTLGRFPSFRNFALPSFIYWPFNMISPSIMLSYTYQ